MPLVKNILIIDDSRSVQLVLKRYLEDSGDEYDFKVFRASNGFEGLRFCRSKTIHLILLDLYMPKMDGIQFLLHRIKNEKLKKIPVIVITSVSNHKIVKQAVKLGANAYLLKPISLVKLKKSIYKVFNVKFVISDSEKVGKSEVYINNDIVVAEIHDSFGDVFINSVKHKLLELATFTKSSVKRFLLIFVSIPEDEISENRLLSFLTFYKGVYKMAQRNIKIITRSEKIKKLIKLNKDIENIEVVNTFALGMQLLNLQLLKTQHSSIRVDFLKPGIALFSTVYDEKGRIIKDEKEPFSAEEIDQLKQNGIKKLYYVKMDDDEKTVFESPLLDMTKIEIPEEKGFLIKE